MKPKTLTPKQQRFVEEYLKDLNATGAARRAGYSVRTVEQQGPRLLGNVGVQAAIQASQLARSARTKIDVDWVLKRLAAQADADLADLYDKDGVLLPVSDWPEVWRRGLVAGVETIDERLDGKVIGLVRKLRLNDRTRTIELIGRHVLVGAWRDKLELTGKDGAELSLQVSFAAPKGSDA